MACIFHKWEGDTCARCGKRRTGAPAKPCEGEHQWQSAGCKKTCAACGAVEGGHDFQKQGGQYGRTGKPGMYQNYRCEACKAEVILKVSDTVGVDSLQAGHFMDFASILGIGPEYELNKVVGAPPKELAFNGNLLKQK